jgi:hypothetical protein
MEHVIFPVTRGFGEVVLDFQIPTKVEEGNPPFPIRLERMGHPVY